MSEMDNRLDFSLFLENCRLELESQPFHGTPMFDVAVWEVSWSADGQRERHVRYGASRKVVDLL